MTTTVLLAESHGILRDGLHRLLEANPDIRVVATADNGQEAVAKAARLAPDVVVMDVSAPWLSIDATRSIITQQHAATILMLSMHSSGETVREALAVGARGFLLRESARDDVVEAVRAVSAGRVFLGDGVTRKVAARKDPAAR
jgi:DNA-binding NarL/FixJ family response regulator